ncbi:hypothetical protein OF83DRAFT_408890 [Amylostereum chailletii]|nr:hypothetical protein OF83DRAFT_408890 [Amylostereum chailletii]
MSVTLSMVKCIENVVLPVLSLIFSSAKPSQFLKKWTPRAGQLAPSLYRSRKRVLKQLGSSPSEEDIFYSLHMTLKVLDEEAEIEEFFAGLPGFLHSRFVEGMAPQTAVYLIRKQNIMKTVEGLMQSCTDRPSFPESKATRRVETVLGALQSILPCVMTSVETLDSLRNTGDERRSIAPLIGVFMRYFVHMRTKQDVLATVRRIGAYVRLKDTVMSRILSNDSIGSDPLRDQYVENIMHRIETSSPRFTFSDLPLKTAIRREKCLANINAYILAITPALDMDRDRYAEVVSQTLNQLYSSLTSAYHAEDGRLSQRQVDRFASNWQVIQRSQEYQSRTVQQDANASKLFRILRACARLILPLATPPNPRFTRLPPSTDSEEQYLEGDDGHKLQPATVARPPDTYAVYPDGYAARPVSEPTRKQTSKMMKGSSDANDHIGEVGAFVDESMKETSNVENDAAVEDGCRRSDEQDGE